MPTIVVISGTSRPNNYTSKALKVVGDALEARGTTLRRFDARWALPGSRSPTIARSASLMFPAIVETHYTLGGSVKLGEQIRIDLGYMKALKNSVSGSNASEYYISKYQTSLEEESVELGVAANF